MTLALKATMLRTGAPKVDQTQQGRNWTTRMRVADGFPVEICTEIKCPHWRLAQVPG